MTSERHANPAPAVTYCSNHPSVESELRYGRCERLICPRCLVFTPSGVRCADCAMLRRPPMYELATGDYVRAAVAAALVGAALGAAGSILLPPRGFVGFFSMLLALLGGSGAGSIMAGAVTRVTHGKRGVPMQLAAVGGIIVAGVVRLAPFVAWDGLEQIRGDTVGLLLVVVASIVAWGRLASTRRDDTSAATTCGRRSRAQRAVRCTSPRRRGCAAARPSGTASRAPPAAPAATSRSSHASTPVEAPPPSRAVLPAGRQTARPNARRERAAPRRGGGHDDGARRASFSVRGGTSMQCTGQASMGAPLTRRAAGPYDQGAPRRGPVV